MKIKKRKLELVVLSDTHLGTIGARAEELLKYLKSIEPETKIMVSCPPKSFESMTELSCPASACINNTGIKYVTTIAAVSDPWPKANAINGSRIYGAKERDKKLTNIKASDVLSSKFLMTARFCPIEYE